MTETLLAGITLWCFRNCWSKCKYFVFHIPPKQPQTAGETYQWYSASNHNFPFSFNTCSHSVTVLLILVCCLIKFLATCCHFRITHMKRYLCLSAVDIKGILQDKLIYPACKIDVDNWEACLQHFNSHVKKGRMAYQLSSKMFLR